MVKYFCDKCNKETEVFKSGPRKGFSKDIRIDVWGDVTKGHINGTVMLCEKCSKEIIDYMVKNKFAKIEKAEVSEGSNK